jgi:hypothetical protein
MTMVVRLVQKGSTIFTFCMPFTFIGHLRCTKEGLSHANDKPSFFIKISMSTVALYRRSWDLQEHLHNDRHYQRLVTVAQNNLC